MPAGESDPMPGEEAIPGGLGVLDVDRYFTKLPPGSRARPWSPERRSGEARTERMRDRLRRGRVRPE